MSKLDSEPVALRTSRDTNGAIPHCPHMSAGSRTSEAQAGYYRGPEVRLSEVCLDRS
jgi:hypothetical protein